jgi:hypothetical protein
MELEAAVEAIVMFLDKGVKLTVVAGPKLRVAKDSKMGKECRECRRWRPDDREHRNAAEVRRGGREGYQETGDNDVPTIGVAEQGRNEWCTTTADPLERLK